MTEFVQFYAGSILYDIFSMNIWLWFPRTMPTRRISTIAKRLPLRLESCASCDNGKLNQPNYRMGLKILNETKHFIMSD